MMRAKSVLEALHDELDELEKNTASLKKFGTQKRRRSRALSTLNRSLDQVRTDMDIARRAGDLNRMSELQYGRIPELERQLDLALQAEMQDMSLLKNRVTDEEIADVLSRWTGIPVSKMLEGEREKLVQMESLLHNEWSVKMRRWMRSLMLFVVLEQGWAIRTVRLARFYSLDQQV